MEPLDVYVLGAGASYVHGAPLTDEIVPLALNHLRSSEKARLQPLRDFLKRAFHFAPRNKLGGIRPGEDPHWRNCPGLVDILSLVDMALDRREILVQGFDLDGLRKVRRSIEFAIFRSLEWSLSRGHPTGRRSDATRRLVSTMSPRDSAIISFNYDVVIDIALSSRAEDTLTFNSGDGQLLGESLNIDYGVAFANLPPNSGDEERFKLLKLHGSFNWVASSLTGNLYYGGISKKAVGSVMSYQGAIAAPQRRAARRVANMFGFYARRSQVANANAEIAALEPVLVTPTHMKDLRNHHMSQLWRNAEEVLRRARKITFIGYSLPGDDLHVKYLFKHALETRSHRRRPKIVVVDYQPAEEGSERSEVEANYRRFFGEIDFHGDGFDAFVDRL